MEIMSQFAVISFLVVILLQFSKQCPKIPIKDSVYDLDIANVCPKPSLIQEVQLKYRSSVVCPLNSLSCILNERIKEKHGNHDDPGGWLTRKEDCIAQPGPCNIDKIPVKELGQKQFLTQYAFQKPVVIVNATNNKDFKELTKYENLLRYYGHTSVKLSSANSYSYENKVMTFVEYCQTHLKPQSLSALGNETFYFFGDNSNEAWFSLLNEYNYPPYFLPGHNPQGSFGIAGPGSGVPFHFHGPGFAETLWGRKRWFMYPPKSSPPFHPNRTTLQWLQEEYVNLKKDTDLLECTLSPGELIYFPDHWWHATLNIDTTVFMSTFLSSFVL